MSKRKLVTWEDVINQINSAFKNVKLGKGIGYFEAEALDNYLAPNNPEYLRAKSLDERIDWSKFLSSLKNKNLSEDRHCFMDQEGLLFYLPVLLSKKSSSIEFLIENYISIIYKRDGYAENLYYNLFSSLSSQQKHSIYLYYNYLNKNDIEYSNDLLNSPFETGEAIFEGFEYIRFIEDHFKNKIIEPNNGD